VPGSCSGQSHFQKVSLRLWTYYGEGLSKSMFLTIQMIGRGYRSPVDREGKFTFSSILHQ
jgi:hypothetical protein